MTKPTPEVMCITLSNRSAGLFVDGKLIVVAAVGERIGPMEETASALAITLGARFSTKYITINLAEITPSWAEIYERAQAKTPKSQEEYLANPAYCPFCSASVMEGAAADLSATAQITKQIRCLHCNRCWIDIYTLTGYEPVEG